MTRTDAVATLLAIACATFAVARWVQSAPLQPPASEQSWVIAPEDASRESMLTSSLDQLEGHNPFRLSGSPALVRHDEAPLSASAVGEPYRPTLVLRGIIGGPPWTAVIGGVPGRTGDVIVGVGERVDSIEVRAISAREVVLVGPDTTWRLLLHSPDR